MKTSKTYFIVKRVDSIGSYLILENANDEPKFTGVADYISKYSSKELAQLIIERISEKVFPMELETGEMKITYEIS